MAKLDPFGDEYQVSAADDTVEVIPRRRFVEEFGEEYKPGQHVTFLGPSGRGKTMLAGQLLLSVRSHNEDIRGVVLHGKIKGRDLTIERLAKTSGFPIVAHWPPRGFRQRYLVRKHQGAILRPLEHPAASVKEENGILHDEYQRAIHRSYQAPRSHPVIVVADEAHQTHNDLGLRGECEGPLMRGRPVCSMWSLVQRGRYVLATTCTTRPNTYLSSTIQTETIRDVTAKSGMLTPSGSLNLPGN